MRAPLAILAALTATGAVAQSNSGTIALHTLPAFVGGATTLSNATPSINVSARSLRVTGSWQVCSAVNYGGTCQTITADQPLYRGPAIRSVRPTPDANAAGTTAGSTSTNTGTATSAKIDLDALDAGNGTAGQDVDFYAQPAFGSDQVAAGTNDKTAADAFCKRAGASTSVYASRGRVQQSNLIDLSTVTKVRGFALRDVLCRR